MPVRQTHYNKNPDYVNGAERKWSRNRVGTGSSPCGRLSCLLSGLWRGALDTAYGRRYGAHGAHHPRTDGVCPCRPSPAASAPTEKSTAAPTEAATQPPTEPGPLDLNRATAQELTTLPGIGEVLAQRIVDYREAHGPFRSVDELIAVEGIGEGKLEKLRELVTVEVEP